MLRPEKRTSSTRTTVFPSMPPAGISVGCGDRFSRYNYELDGQFLMTDSDEQTRDEYGLKIGVSF